jgi:hypothetical protein
VCRGSASLHPPRGRDDGGDAAGGGDAPAGHRAGTPRDVWKSALGRGPLACDRPGASAPLSRSTPCACYVAIARSTAEGPVAQDIRVRTISYQRKETS